MILADHERPQHIIHQVSWHVLGLFSSQTRTPNVSRNHVKLMPTRNKIWCITDKGRLVHISMSSNCKRNTKKHASTTCYCNIFHEHELLACHVGFAIVIMLNKANPGKFSTLPKCLWTSPVTHMLFLWLWLRTWHRHKWVPGCAHKFSSFNACVGRDNQMWCI